MAVLKEDRQQCFRGVYWGKHMAWDKHHQLALVTTATRARAVVCT